MWVRVMARLRSTTVFRTHWVRFVFHVEIRYSDEELSDHTRSCYVMRLRAKDLEDAHQIVTRLKTFRRLVEKASVR